MPATPELWRDLGQINTVDPGTGIDLQVDPKVVHLTNGNILYSWTSDADVGAGAANGFDVIGKIYDSRGNLVQDEFRLNNDFSIDNERDADIAALPGGGFVVVYVDIDDPNTTDTTVRIEQWTAAGTFVNGTVIATDSTDSDTFRNPSVAVSSDSSVLVSWEHVNPDSDATLGDVNVQHAVYNATTNTVGSTFTPFTGGEGADQGISGNAVTALSNGNYVLAYGNDNPGNDAVEARILNAAGVQIGGTITVASAATYEEDPHVVGLTGGGFVVVYEISATDPPTNSGLRARVYDNAGTAVSGFLIPATTTPGNQKEGVVAALADGGFIIAWIDEDTQDIHGQRFNAAGTKVGTEFDIDTNIGNLNVSGLDIEGLDDGRFIVTWEEGNITFPGGLPNIDHDVRSAIFDPRSFENSTAVYTDNQVIGTNLGDLIFVSESDDNVFGHGGGDEFEIGTSDLSGKTFDGGAGNDEIELPFSGTYDFQSTTLLSIETLELDAAGPSTPRTAILRADQVATGQLATDAKILGGSPSGGSDTLRFVMGADTNLDLSGFTFSDWESDNDIIEIIGDGDAETITGSSQNDIIEGGDGGDTLDGGGGIDTASYGDSASGLVADLQFASNNTGIAAGDSYISIENVTACTADQCIIAGTAP